MWHHESVALARPLAYPAFGLLVLIPLSVILRGVGGLSARMKSLICDPAVYTGLGLIGYLFLMAQNVAWPDGIGEDTSVAWYSRAIPHPDRPGAIDSDGALFLYLLVLCVCFFTQ